MCLAILLTVLLQGLFSVLVVGRAKDMCFSGAAACSNVSSNYIIPVPLNSSSQQFDFVWADRSSFDDGNGFSLLSHDASYSQYVSGSYRIDNLSSILTYESNNCYEEVSPAKIYVEVWASASKFRCQYAGYNTGTTAVYQCGISPSPSIGASVYKNYSYEYPSPGTFSCGSRVLDVPGGLYQGLFFWLKIKFEDSSAVCEYVNDKACNVCSWPYKSVRDTVGCGCKIDQSKYQSSDDLKRRVYLYCQTYNDGTGGQYYLDLSRSNFISSNGEIRGACSSPTTGQTVYMPANTCPVGSSVDTLTFDPDSVQPADGTIDPPLSSGSGSDTATHNRLDSILGNIGRGDTATHNRLDTIIDLLRNQNGSGSGGYDSALVPKLDSLRRFLDTVGSSSHDSAYNRLQYVFDSLNSDTLQYRPYIDSIMSNINIHASRGDTSMANGITVDSILNFCVSFNDSLHCLKDTPIYPYMVSSVKWIRRLCLAIWAFLCAGTFFSIATGGNKND